VTGRRVPGGAPPAMEEIMAAIVLGLQKRSWPPSCWDYGRGSGCCNLHLTPPHSRSKPSPPPEHTRGMGELVVLLLLSEFLDVRHRLRKRSWLPSGWGYGRGRGRRRVGAMEEVTATATCLSHRPAPDLNPRRCRSTHAGWGSSSSSSWPTILLMPPQNCSRSTSSGIQHGRRRHGQCRDSTANSPRKHGFLC
jgi:hypothetical protein